MDKKYLQVFLYGAVVFFSVFFASTIFIQNTNLELYNFFLAKISQSQKPGSFTIDPLITYCLNGSSAVNLHWSSSANVSSYLLERRLLSQTSWDGSVISGVIPAEDQDYLDTDLSNVSGEYSYRLQATNNGFYTFSNTQNITITDCQTPPPPPTPTPTPIPTPSPAPVCTPSWQCSSWTSCTNSQQTRSCSDANACGILTDKPITTQSCMVPPPPTIPLTSTKFVNGDRVQVKSGIINLNVRSTALMTGTVLGVQPTGALGTIIGGPSYDSINKYWFWQVNYDSGVDGWSVEWWLDKVTTPPATPVPAPAPAPTPPPIPTPTPTLPAPVCNSIWQCSSWSICINSQQTRLCTDANSCGVLINKPSEIQSCIVPPPPPPPPPTTPLTSTKFSDGDRVKVGQGIANLNVRSTPFISGIVLGTQPTGTLGTIISGPSYDSVNKYWFWQVNYDSGVDGWSVEWWLDKVTTPAPAPTPAPSPTPDNSIPTVSIGNPLDNATVFGTINITANASDNIGVSLVEFYIDGIVKSNVSILPYVYLWNSRTVLNGIHTILVKAHDLAGNIGKTIINIMVNNPTPTSKLWGTYTGWYDSSLPTFESLVGKSVNAQTLFIHWGNENQFPSTSITNPLKNTNKTLIIFWDSMDYTIPSINQPSFSLDTIIAGNWDSYIKSFASSVRAYGGPVIIIPFEEANGNWDVWSGTNNGNTPAKVVAAYQHIHDAFGPASNVKWGLALNSNSVPDTASNAIELYYPGDSYVDYMGLDGFNFGSPWLSFSQIFDTPLAKLSAFHKPIYIFSFASAEGSGKAAWITDALTVQIPKHQEIAGWTWFNENKEQDWRVNSSPAALNAFKAALP